MKKTILSFGLMCIFSLILFVGTTYAWFSEEVTVNNNEIESGEMLAVQYDVYKGESWHSIPCSKIFDANDLLNDDELWPGESLTRHIRITNPNSRPVAVSIRTFGESGSLDNLDFSIAVSNGGTSIDSPYIPIRNMNNYYVVIPANSYRTFAVTVMLNTHVTLENGSFYFDVTFTATQVGAKVEQGATEIFD